MLFHLMDSETHGRLKQKQLFFSLIVIFVSLIQAKQINLLESSLEGISNQILSFDKIPREFCNYLSHPLKYYM